MPRRFLPHTDVGPSLQPLTQVAALAEDARLPLSAQVDALTSALATACGACCLPSPAPQDVRSALLAVADRRAFTAAHPAGAPADPEGLGVEARWVVRDLKLLPGDGGAREDAAQRRARREAALRRQGGIAAVRAALAMSPDAPGAAALLAASLAALDAASVCLGDHDAAAGKARRRREERRAKEAAAGGAGASPDGAPGDCGGDAAGDASAMGASPSSKKAKVVLSDEEKAAKAAEKAAKDAEKAAKDAEKAAKAEEKALKDADKAAKAADKAAKDAKASAAAARQANMMRGFFGAKPPAAPPQASRAAAPSQPAGGASADAEAGVAAVQAGGEALAVATALVASVLPSEGAMAAMDARLARRVDAPPARDVLAAHMCAWRPSGAGAGGRPQARRWGARRASRRDRHFDPLRAGGSSVGVAAVEDDAPAVAAARRKLLQVDTSELRFELGPAAFLAPPTGGPTPLVNHPRPAYWGTWPPDRPKAAAPSLRRGRRPLTLGPGLDYELDSAEEWEEEEPGESLNGDSDGEREEEDPMAVSDIDEGDGFVVADDYLSEDERADDVVPTPGDGEASALMGGCGIESARAKAAERLRAEVDVRAERARKQGKMLIVSSLHVAGAAAAAAPEPDAAAAAAAPISTPPPMAPQATGAHLLQGYAVEAFSKHVIGRPASAADAVAPPSHAPSAAVGGGASGAPEGGSARGRKVSSFPEDLAPALVRLMLASPGVQVVKLTDEFVSGAGAKRATKVATKERVNALGKYEKGRWELGAEALLLIGLTREQADAARPPPPPMQPRAPKPKPAAHEPPLDAAPSAVAPVAEAPVVEAEAEPQAVAMEE